MTRIEPTPNTKYRLLALSGNQCAFPECTENLVDADDHFIGQFCHIEAASEGGERYNSEMTDEERRDISNLILLCAKHHIVTNDIKMFSTETLHLMKTSHESKHRDEYQPPQDVIDQITESVSAVIEKAIAQNSQGFVPYAQNEYLQDMQGAQQDAVRQTENALRQIHARGGGGSVDHQVSAAFTNEANKKRAEFQRRRAQTVRLYRLRAEQINDEFATKEQKGLSVLAARNMLHSGQTIVLKEQIEKDKARAIELLNIEFDVAEGETVE